MKKQNTFNVKANKKTVNIHSITIQLTVCEIIYRLNEFFFRDLANTLQK